MLQLAFDIGGTFTDFALYNTESGRVNVWKVPTTAQEPAKAVLESLVAQSRLGVFHASSISATLHATTIATNAILERKGSATVSELAEPFEIGLPSVMKHLDVLADAGLITRRKLGRTVTVWLRFQPMREAMAWLNRYERFWSGGLARLAAHAERKEAEARGRDR